MAGIIQAKNFAKKKHAGQLRKNGKTTTFSHLQDVVKNLKKMKVTNEDIICAGWLHDTIEDTETDYDMIKDLFGKRVADIVVSVTKDNRLPKKQREAKYAKDLRTSNAKAKLVKIAEKVDIIPNEKISETETKVLIITKNSKPLSKSYDLLDKISLSSLNKKFVDDSL